MLAQFAFRCLLRFIAADLAVRFFPFVPEGFAAVLPAAAGP